MARSVYEVVRVDEQPSSIRVLELHPGPPGSPLKGRLVLCCLEDEARTPYTALSYTWGTQTAEDTTIQLQDGSEPVSVWANLKHALHTLRSPEVSVRLWIDAICIDQSDTHDKNLQLPLMGRIYALAAKTVIWLGPAGDDTALGMESVRAIGDERRKHETVPSQAWLEASLTSAHWAAIGSLMASPWWGRIWIVQEVLKSNNSHVQCGDATAALDDFVALEEVRYTYIRAVEGLRLLPRYPLSVIFSSWGLNLRDARSDACPLLEWLVVTERFAFTKPRDRFYALLGLTNPAARQAIEVEYDESRMSDALLNVNAVVHCLSQFRMLLPLQFPHGGDRPPGLPSWCPDWYRPDHGYQSLAFDEGEGGFLYEACGPRHTHAPLVYHGPPLTNATAAGCDLWLRGWPVDTLAFVDAFTPFELERETTPALQAAGRAARRRALHAKCGDWRAAVEAHIADGRPHPYGSAAGLRAAFWRTLIADRASPSRGPPPESFGRGLDQFLDDDDDETAPLAPTVMSYLVVAAGRLLRRAFVISSRGYLGLAPGHAAPGDDVCVFEGGRVPFVLRGADGETAAAAAAEAARDPDNDEKTTPRYTWVGEAYVHGIMQGEWVAELERHQGQSPELVGFVVI